MSQTSEPNRQQESETSRFEFSLEEMRKSVRSGPPLPWLEASWVEPAAFYATLWHALDESKIQRSKTQLFSSYSIYHDLVGRHHDSSSIAFIHHEPSLGWQTLTYSALDKRTKAMATRWIAAGIQPGARVLLLLPLDTEWLTSLLCALRVGCRVCWIPPRGKRFVQNRIVASEFDWLISPKRYASYVAPWKDKCLEPPALDSAALVDEAGAHAYAPDEVVLDVFPSSSNEELKSHVVCAENLYLGMLRDATLLLELNPNDRVMLPYFDVLQHLPNHVLTTLLTGATFVEGDIALLQQHENQRRHWPTIVGVSPKLRDKVLSGEVEPKNWRLCHWNPGMPFDWQAWDDFVRKLHESGSSATTMNYLSSSSAGGSSLWSTRQSKRMPLGVYPAPGVPWELRDMTAPDQAAQGGTGVYTPIDPRVPVELDARFVLSRFTDGYVFSGSHQPLRNGVHYPATEVVKLVSSVPEINGASVVSQLVSEPLFQHKITLLIFIDEVILSSTGEKALQKRYVEWISNELSEEAEPDQIRFLPLYAKRDENGNIDHDWCRTQFLDGTLERKSKDILFRELGRLRHLIDALDRENEAKDVPWAYK